MDFKLKGLKLTNFRAFKDFTVIGFNQNLNVLIGINGAGKSSLLDAIGYSINRLILEVIVSGSGSFLPKDVDILSTQNELDISSDFFLSENQTHSTTVQRKLNDNRGLSYTLSNVFIKHDSQGKEILTDTTELPVFGYYPTNRNFNDTQNTRTNNARTNQYNKNYSRFQTYLNCLNNIIDYNSLSEWLLEQMNIQNQERINKKDFGYEINSIKAINRTLKIFFEELHEREYVEVKTSRSQYNQSQTIVFSSKGSDTEFNLLSSGEKLILGTVLDLSFKCILANPQLENPMNAFGIVLIDEIELHLHPKWQLNVINAFRTTFPNIQFFFATHSPLVVANCKNENLWVLNNRELIHATELGDEIYGSDVNKVLKVIMGTEERPSQIASLIEEIEKLIDAEAFDEKQVALKIGKLEELITPNDPEITHLKMLAEYRKD